MIGRVYFETDLTDNEVRLALIRNNFPGDTVVTPERTLATSRAGLDPTNIKTRAVAASAYKINDIRSGLTHAVDQTTDKPLCDRVKPENVLDDPYAVDDEDAPATCPICAKRDPRFT